MNNTVKLLIKILVWIPVLVTGILITGFSSQNGNESSGLSQKAAEVIIENFEQVHLISIDSEKERDILIEKMQYPIRKLAHMTEYAIFTAFTYAALLADGINKSRIKIYAFTAGFLLAASDEFHQLFVPGRNGCITDVLIDTVGTSVALLLISLVHGISYANMNKIKNSKKTTNNLDKYK